MLRLKLLGLAILTMACNLATAQNLPTTIHLSNSCWIFTNVQYQPVYNGMNWGWYTATLDTTACQGGGATFPASGPEAKRLDTYIGKGGALTVDLRPAFPTLLIFILSLNNTVDVWDMNGNLVGSDTWY